VKADVKGKNNYDILMVAGILVDLLVVDIKCARKDGLQNYRQDGNRNRKSIKMIRR
jgi:hypothetical protein